MISFVLHFAAAGSGCASGNDKKAAEAAPAKVYMTRDISPAGMKAVYEALGRKAEGKKVAVKLSTGEPGGNNFLQPALIGDLVKSVKGTIVECNTAYGGGRAKTEDHLKAAADHGFTAIAPVDIMDAEGEVRLPVEGGRHLKYDIVGSHFPEYDFVVVLSHFKGHAMGGFGGAIKNISIGIASSAGKAWIHSAGKTEDTEKLWSSLPTQDDFLESMAEAAKAIAAHCGERILYISVMNNLSVDCDCDAHPEPPRMGDIGILASLDPVALDQACVALGGQQLLRLPDGVLVVRAGQSLVRRDQQARRHAGQGLGIGIYRIHIPALYGAVRVEHAADLRLQCLEIRPCVVQILFGLPQLRLGDQIHGVGDLLGLPYASDAPADLTGAGHALTARLRA